MATPIYVHVGDQGGENLQGGNAIDVMDLGSGADTAGGGGGFNIILGGSNADYLRSEGVFEDILAGSGNDTIVATGYGGWLFGGSGDDTIIGSDNGWDHPEHIFGGSGNDTINGGGGNDIIIGGAGDDDLTGGDGADTFTFWEGHGNDTVRDFNFAEGDRIHLTNFDQTITWAQLSTKITTVTDDDNVVTGVQVDLGEWGGGTIMLEGITSVDDVTEDMFVLDQLAGSDSDDFLQGGDSNDTIDGGGGHDIIIDGAGDDTIDGGTGNDYIINQAGDDTITGGTGADTFFFYEGHGDDVVTDFSKAEGDRIALSGFDAAVTWDALSTNITTVTDDDNVVTGVRIDLGEWGGGTITLEGITSVDDVTEDMFVLHALTGSDDVDDRLQGGTGNDTMTGGTGADTFVFNQSSGHDTITDFSKAGGDRIALSGFDAAVTWDALSTNITTITDDDNVVTGVRIDLGEWGGGTITLEGITSVDDLTEDMFDLPSGSTTSRFGTENANAIDGDGGADMIYGMEGDDTLRGEGGGDMIFGGEGDDWLEGGAGEDLLMGGEGDDMIFGGEGDDMMIGGEGSDTMIGGTGADTFVFNQSSGHDTITDFSKVEGDRIDLSAFTNITSIGDLRGYQAGDDAVIVLGFNGGDTITLEDVQLSDLQASDFVLYQNEYTGTAGADTLTGGAGDDTMTGLDGDDTLTGGDGADTFVFAPGHGDDTVIDFTDGEDIIDLSAFSGISGFGDLALTAVGNDIQIDLSAHGGDTITLQNSALDSLDATDFVFHQEDPQDGM